MNNLTSTKGRRNLHNSGLGCMGSMLNIFDLSARMAGTKMLTEKPHRHGSPVCRQVKEAVDPVGSQVEDSPVTNMPKKTSLDKRSSGMPVKMLIEQEMFKEIEAGRKSPSVVARLMGLDALPAKQLAPLAPRIIPAGHHIQNSYTIGEAIQGHQQRQTVYNDMLVPRSVQPLHAHVNEEKEYKDVYEVWEQPSRTKHFKDEPLSTGRYHDKPSEKTMALVHQKFLEAKCLAKNQKLLQSKEFQDALEVLSSNKDIFLKFLEEPNLQFSKHLHEKQTTTHSNKTKCITVLKPSRTLDSTNEKQLKKENMLADVIGWGSDKPSRSSGSTYSISGRLSHLPTRIVVLKPSPQKPHDLKTIMTSPTKPQKCPKGEDYFEESGSNETAGSREVAKEIMRQMRASLNSNRRDETLLSSALSNGYTGDESSFSRSEIMYMEEESGNFSDSQAVTPTSRHSWDYINRLSSPYSLSSYSRASCSPESSVIREAKKRLSERLAMVTTTEVNQEQMRLRRSSSTLGEMLAVSEMLREKGRNEESFNPKSGAREYDLKAASSRSSSKRIQDENSRDRPPRSLQKSKSVPSTSSAFENVEVELKVSDSHVGKSVTHKEATKSKSLKFSFRGKVSGFFSRNKKSSQEKCLTSPLADSLDKIPSSNTTSVNYKSTDLGGCVIDYQPEEDPIHVEETLTKNQCSTSDNDLKQGPLFVKREALSLEKPSFPEILSQNMEQPSPVSVLEAPFEEDTSTCSSLSRDGASLECHRAISSSPLIESITRSLSWEDDAHSNGNTSNLKNEPTGFLKVDIKEQERLDFVTMLLSSSGLDNETTSSALAKWYSLESPLNPLLLDKFMERREEGAKCRERRSRQRLLFDSVNAVLLDISQNYVPYACRQLEKTSLSTCNCTPDTTLVADEVIRRVTRWFSFDDTLASGDRENSSLIVDSVIKKEVCGRGWEDMMLLEIMEIELEIERQVLDELVVEAMDGFISSGCSEDTLFPSCISRLEFI